MTKRPTRAKTKKPEAKAKASVDAMFETTVLIKHQGKGRTAICTVQNEDGRFHMNKSISLPTYMLHLSSERREVVFFDPDATYSIKGIICSAKIPLSVAAEYDLL